MHRSYKRNCDGSNNNYRPQGKVMFSQACVILSTIGLMATRSLLNLVISVCILLECFLVLRRVLHGEESQESHVFRPYLFPKVHSSKDAFCYQGYDCPFQEPQIHTLFKLQCQTTPARSKEFYQTRLRGLCNFCVTSNKLAHFLFDVHTNFRKGVLILIIADHMVM